MNKNDGSCNILSKLGGGTCSEVFLAASSDGAAPFVLKRLVPHLCGNSEYLNLFEHEAAVLDVLHHKGVPHLIDFVRDGERPEIRMQFMAGRSLFSMLQESRKLKETLPLESACRIIEGLLDIAMHVHEARSADGAHLEILHRDICPMNVIVSPQGTAALIDFGSAASIMLKNAPPDALFGRFSYLSPERIHGGRATVADDLFSLGVIAYELFCGVHPFRAFGAEATLGNIEQLSCMSPGCARPGLPPALENFIEKLLRLDAGGGFSSCGAALEAFNSI